MSAVFLKILNMSITASWLILAVILTRLILKKAPKWIPCLLWGLVAIRLICPFSFESVLSVIPSSETIPMNIAEQHEPAITSGITIVNEAVNPVVAKSFTPAPTDSANPLQIIIPVAAIIWITGMDHSDRHYCLHCSCCMPNDRSILKQEPVRKGGTDIY